VGEDSFIFVYDIHVVTQNIVLCRAVRDTSGHCVSLVPNHLQWLSLLMM